ncbi:DISARM system phospholipase D-like protein DrmC [Cellulomonas iranensis]|uniref:Phosphatidylserine/phosphatidylglycerophosphate/ cardiolipin synthase-like enzyme n=1 Tax=Cellulomonas iranensis TaxID=76862 RepID=A0ABU0GKF8_9CELL|nr:DISARM system phospholipase D-like protein DrmC [Cellulomonas iranensis]MDQ0425573.1 phosphatidylserine/phosphatidylglycerophosphate/cardiolipin synthase-like enzyme [Cellulomonas iranensis]
MRADLAALVGLLTPSELRRVAASLEATGRARRAAREVAPDRAPAVGVALAAVVSSFGNATALAAALRVIADAAEDRPEPPVVVWSGPQLQGDSVRTTEAIVRLIDDAEESVLASTYSGSSGAPFVQALRRAAQRKVAITLVVDVVERAETARALAHAVPRATVYGYHHEVRGQVGLQHSKILVIDGRFTLVTSANLSVAAVERHLEAGVLLDDPAVASRVSRRVADLVASAHLRQVE